MTRTEFLGRIRAARQHRSDDPAPTAAELEAARRLPVETDCPALVERFAAQVQAVGMKPHRTTAAGLADTLAGILDQLNARDVRLSTQPPLDDATVAARLSAGGRTVRAWQRGDDAFGADVAISLAAAGLAETGSLVVHSSPQTPRQATLVPPTAIVVVRAEAIIPDLLDALAGLPARFAAGWPANATLITGPSKTSDIEKTLVTGVHGPGRMDVVIVDAA